MTTLRTCASVLLGAVLSFGLGVLDPAREALGSEQPRRVVSMNLCTDQLAMLMAAPGQLHSVSDLARDRRSSVLADEAGHFLVNHGLAEEIFTMQPDLILAGTFTSRASVAMLKRLGFRVEEFPPSDTFDDVRKQIRRVGTLLGRDKRAEELVAELDRNLAAASPGVSTHDKRPLVALHYEQSYTAGAGTLASEVVTHAGAENLGSRLGLSGTVRMPLEILVLAAPDLVVGTSRASPTPALAEETFDHPALRAVIGGRKMLFIPDKYWVCGAPFTAEAVRILADAIAPLRTHEATKP